MGKAAKLKKLRRLAERATQHLPGELYTEQRAPVQTLGTKPTRKLGECTKGAYKALKRGRVNVVHHEV